MTEEQIARAVADGIRQARLEERREREQAARHVHDVTAFGVRISRESCPECRRERGG